MDAFVIKRNDLQPSIAAVLSDDLGTFVIPDGATAQFVMRLRATRNCDGTINPAPSSPKVLADAVIVDNAGGSVRYDWQSGDTDTPGLYDGEFKITANGLPISFPSLGFIPINVLGDIA